MTFPPESRWKKLERVTVEPWHLTKTVVGRFVSIHGGAMKVLETREPFGQAGTEISRYYECPPTLFFTLWPYVQKDDFLQIVCDSCDGGHFNFSVRMAKADDELFELEKGN